VTLICLSQATGLGSSILNDTNVNVNTFRPITSRDTKYRPSKLRHGLSCLFTALNIQSDRHIHIKNIKLLIYQQTLPTYNYFQLINIRNPRNTKNNIRLATKRGRLFHCANFEHDLEFDTTAFCHARTAGHLRRRD